MTIYEDEFAKALAKEQQDFIHFFINYDNAIKMTNTEWIILYGKVKGGGA